VTALIVAEAVRSLSLSFDVLTPVYKDGW